MAIIGFVVIIYYILLARYGEIVEELVFYRKLDIMLVAAVIIWINVFPDTGDTMPEKYTYWHIHSSIYPFFRVFLPMCLLGGLIYDRWQLWWYNYASYEPKKARNKSKKKKRYQ